MADFGSTKYNASFEEWHELLMDYAELRGGSAADAEAWRDDYEAGKIPVEAYCDEWGDDWLKLCAFMNRYGVRIRQLKPEHGKTLLTGYSRRPAWL